MTDKRYSGFIIRSSPDDAMGVITSSTRICVYAEDIEAARERIIERYHQEENRWTPYRTSEKFPRDKISVDRVREERKADSGLIRRIFGGFDP